MRLPPLSFGWAVSIALALALSGCGAFRLHDPGRMQTAGEALKSATELSSGGGAVFTPMEQNLDAVRSTQEKLRRLTDLHEFETFRGVLHRLGAEELGVRVVEALEKYNGANTFILEREAAAARSINDQLDRQALITKILNDSSAESAAARSRLDTTLKRIKTRLDWIEAAQSRLAAVKELTGASRPAGDVASVLIGGLDPKTDTGKAVADAIKAAENSLKNVESDKRVEAAEQLVKRAAEQTAASEHERLVEMQRYLADLARARQRLAVRDQIVACNVVPVLLGHLFPVLGNAEQTRFVAVYRDLQQRHSCIQTWSRPRAMRTSSGRGAPAPSPSTWLRTSWRPRPTPRRRFSSRQSVSSCSTSGVSSRPPSWTSPVRATDTPFGYRESPPSSGSVSSTN